MVEEISGHGVSADAPLMEAGVDSLGAVELRNQLQRAAARELPGTLMFDAPTVRQLAALLGSEAPSVLPQTTGMRRSGIDGSAAAKVGGSSVVMPNGVNGRGAALLIIQVGLIYCLLLTAYYLLLTTDY
jgi:acyl carrier protein